MLLPDGALHSVHHTLAEAATGANLTEDQAQARAVDFLRESKKIDLSRWKLVEAQSNKLPARTDHSFIWEELQPINPAPPGAETAHVRISLVVQGDEVSGYRIFIHLPEDWVRRQNATTLANTLQSVLFVSLVGGLGLAMLIIFLRNLKTSLAAAVPWRGIALWSLVVLAASLVRFATLVPQYLLTYRTDQPFATFIGTLLIGQTLAASLLYSGTIFLLGLAVFFLAQGYGFDRVPVARILPSVYYRDAILIMLCGWAILAGLRRLHDLVAALWPVAHYGFPASVPEGLDAIWPASSSLATAIIFSILGGGCDRSGLGVRSRVSPPRVDPVAGARGAGDFLRAAMGQRRRLRANCASDFFGISGNLVGGESPRAAQFTRISFTGDAVVVDPGNRRAAEPAQRLFPLERRAIDRRGRHPDRFAARFVAWRSASRVAVQQVRADVDFLFEGSLMRGREQTESRTSGRISTARRWAEYLVAILGGNILYLAVEPQLPIPFRHRMFQIDLGLALDFLICVALYGLIRLVRGSGSPSA